MNNSGKTFVIGDIHGAAKALFQCLERASFNKEKDVLISLGDLTDGWPDSFDVLEQLIQLANVILIKGNHDVWAMQWMNSGELDANWYQQGGKNTIKSYPDMVPESHRNFYNKARAYYVLDNNVFVHGGFDPETDIEDQNEDTFLWDRSLVQLAQRIHDINPRTTLSAFKRIFVGHTPTLNFNADKPLNYCNVTLMDTGAGWPGGRLSMLRLDDGKIIQSDKVDTLYAGISPR